MSKDNFLGRNTSPMDTVFNKENDRDMFQVNRVQLTGLHFTRLIVLEGLPNKFIHRFFQDLQRHATVL